MSLPHPILHLVIRYNLPFHNIQKLSPKNKRKFEPIEYHTTDGSTMFFIGKCISSPLKDVIRMVDNFDYPFMNENHPKQIPRIFNDMIRKQRFTIMALLDIAKVKCNKDIVRNLWKLLLTCDGLSSEKTLEVTFVVTELR